MPESRDTCSVRTSGFCAMYVVGFETMEGGAGEISSRTAGTWAKKAAPGFLYGEGMTMPCCGLTAGTEVHSRILGFCGLNLQSGELCVRHLG